MLLAKGGIALPQSHGLRQGIDRHKGRLNSEFTLARLRRKVPTVEALREQVERAAAGEEADYPRWVRVNALKTSIEDQLETTFAKFSHTNELRDVITKTEKSVYIDPHVPGLLAITQGTDITKTEAYSSGKIILQDKASCFPAYLLDPRSEDGDVVDACAAPGNKTTHLAAIIYTHRPEFESAPQTIYAFEKDAKRAKTLEKMTTIAGSRKMTRIGPGQDFLQVDPHAERYRDVGALLLDPSCSGSGIVGRDSMPELHLPGAPDNSKPKASSKQGAHNNSRKRKHEEVEKAPENVLIDDEGNETVVNSEKDLQARLDSLAAFQLSLLLHAMEFPAARKISYSTCSIHAQENEHVVLKALNSDVARKGGWRILLRKDQVSGMRDWPVRGVPEACKGQKDVAEACIRSYKGDGRGVMGFFVAGFVRAWGSDATSTGDQTGPYLADEDGVIVRDVLGMPILKATGAPVSLEARNEVSPSRAESDPASTDTDSDEDSTSDSSAEDEAEWNGFGD